MGSMGSRLRRLIAWMEDVLVVDYYTRMYLRGPTTIYSLATPSTQNTTPSFKQASRPALEPLSTPHISRASSAPTSSNTQRLGGSLFLVEYKTIQGERTLTFAIKEDAIASFKKLNELYRIVTLSEEKTTTTTTVLRDSSNPGV